MLDPMSGNQFSSGLGNSQRKNRTIKNRREGDDRSRTAGTLKPRMRKLGKLEAEQQPEEEQCAKSRGKLFGGRVAWDSEGHRHDQVGDAGDKSRRSFRGNEEEPTSKRDHPIFVLGEGFPPKRASSTQQKPKEKQRESRGKLSSTEKEKAGRRKKRWG